MKSVSGIYIILNVKNGKIYIGQSQNMRSRWQHHRSDLKKNIHSNKHLQRAWNKYGEKVFEFKILERCSIEELNDREQHFIDIYLPKNNCYNLSPTAGSTRGIKVTKETRIKLSNAHKGHRPTEETRAKLKSHMIGNTYGKGHSHTEETRLRISEKLGADWIVTDPMGIEYRVRSLKRFCIQNKLNASHMASVANGKRTHHKGWVCRKVD